MGWSKLFKGEPMPDRDDPKYQKRHEQMYAAGDSFARATGLTWLGRKITDFAYGHKKLFLTLVLGFAVSVFLLQTCRFVMYLNSTGEHTPVTERVDSALQDRFERSQKTLEHYEKENRLP